eukprot:638006-Amphidinium_carterae.1
MHASTASWSLSPPEVHGHNSGLLLCARSHSMFHLLQSGPIAYGVDGLAAKKTLVARVEQRIAKKHLD